MEALGLDHIGTALPIWAILVIYLVKLVLDQVLPRINKDKDAPHGAANGRQSPPGASVPGMAAVRIDPQFERFLNELNTSLRKAAEADQQLLAVLLNIQRSNVAREAHEEAVIKLLNRLVLQVQEQHDSTRELISDQRALIDDVATDTKQSRKIVGTIFDKLMEDTGRHQLPFGPRTKG